MTILFDNDNTNGLEFIGLYKNDDHDSNRIKEKIDREN